MIRPDACLTIQRIPLARLIVTEYQPRYLARVIHYVALMQQPEHVESAPGLLCVKPRADGYYDVLDRAVWAAYGWDDGDPAAVPEDDLLTRLLQLNFERSS